MTSATFETFIDLIRDGFEPGDSPAGRVALLTDGGDGRVIEVDDRSVRVEREGRGDVDATVRIEAGILDDVLDRLHSVDWREPAIGSRVRLEGDVKLAAHALNACLRPGDWAVETFARAEREHRDGGFSTLETVARTRAPSQAQVLERIAEGRPFVIEAERGTSPHWSVERLNERFGRCIARSRLGDTDQSIEAFVDEISRYEPPDDTDGVVHGVSTPYTLGSILADEMIPAFTPRFFEREDFLPPRLWFGVTIPGVPLTPLHRDPLNGFLHQFIGRKRFTLYSADQAALLRPVRGYNNYQLCWNDPERPRPGNPTSAAARSISVTLEPNEILVTPAGWFHQVHAVDSPNLSVSYFGLRV